jgi:hypothetical protein
LANPEANMGDEKIDALEKETLRMRAERLRIEWDQKEGSKKKS